jgi:hypothetical protein
MIGLPILSYINVNFCKKTLLHHVYGGIQLRTRPFFALWENKAVINFAVERNVFRQADRQALLSWRRTCAKTPEPLFFPTDTLFQVRLASSTPGGASAGTSCDIADGFQFWDIVGGVRIRAIAPKRVYGEIHVTTAARFLGRLGITSAAALGRS